jgi:antibiotic biosynthesis monooxygenase (ABM) superfamily enzyme
VTQPGPTVVVSRRVRPGGEQAFEEWLHRLRVAMEKAPGYVAATFTPPNRLHPDEWVMLYQFDDRAGLEAWLSSSERLELIEESGAYLAGDAVEQQVVRPGAEWVTLVSSVRLRPGSEQSHLTLHEEAVEEARRLGGLVRDEVVSAASDMQDDTVALLTFATRADLQRWLDSEPRRRILRAMEGLAEGDRTVNVVGGFAGWFHSGGAPSTKRWKQATVVIIGLVPVACVVSLAREAFLPGVPMPWSSALSTVVNVGILTWGVMPWLTRALAGWLAR